MKKYGTTYKFKFNFKEIKPFPICQFMKINIIKHTNFYLVLFFIRNDIHFNQILSFQFI